MLYFENDYCEGAHPAVLNRLMETNMEKLPGYGTDPYTESAKEKIRRACGCPEAGVFLLTGGTQTNAVVIASMLKRYEGVVAATTGHVSVHEAGAIEFTGHKVLEVPGKVGKMEAGTLRSYLEAFYGDGNHEHMVFPGMAYISQPTEYGTLYTKAEMEAISKVCSEYELPLYVDGARMGYGLACRENEVTLADLARLTTVFYIGGTKVGALCGEAVVFPKKAPKHFMTMVKQQGALLAKGRVLGVQFDTLFTDIALVLHMEHGGGNNSSFTTHVVSSSGTDTYSSVAASLGSLKGPRHGGANIKVVRMFEDMKQQVKDWNNEEEVGAYLRALLHKEAFDHAGLIYGMGHAVYSLSDPRANIFKSFVKRLSVEKGREEEFALYSMVERLAPQIIGEERQIYKGVSANVDFYSGFVYSMLDLPLELYTPIFAMARIVGWSAHRIEELANNGKIIRPAYKSVAERQEYVKLGER